jgi:hypothetical protein
MLMGVPKRNLGNHGQNGSMLMIFLEGKLTACTSDQHLSYHNNLVKEYKFQLEEK